MTRLRELFEEAVESPPPSRLSAADVYAAGRHRHQLRRRWTVAAGAAVTTCVAVVSIAAIVATGAAPWGIPDRSVDGAASTSQQLPSPRVLPPPGEHIQWVGGADEQHLYVALSQMSSCPAAPCAKTIVHLVGSDDGGRTWSDRGAPMNVAYLADLGPGTLAAATVSTISGPTNLSLQTSTDGGRTWNPVERVAAVAAVPTGSTAVCWSDRAPDAATSPCTLQALDPVARRIAPLTGQPPLIPSEDLLVEESAGQLWVPGTDPATGRPAVAVSTDAGRSWLTEVFTDAPGCALEGCPSPLMAMGAGRTGYAVVVGAREWAVYRRSDSGGWERLIGADQVPHERAVVGSFVAADGTHVLYTRSTERAAEGYRYWAAHGSGTYQPVELDGLPAQASPIRRASAGWFYAYGPDNVYGSTDGWRWSALIHR